ncbi:proto-oncogene tyrosine-protein kinase receptor Ret-like isoform X1 [Lytechinus pictus]|uniref:proto-oncogene tyrosine-protein kinase receptor Ret-like isoform X1 n=1 Tax=Lytechinus pictus TaxID=7653 RepID=UPI0030B9B8D4
MYTVPADFPLNRTIARVLALTRHAVNGVRADIRYSIRHDHHRITLDDGVANFDKNFRIDPNTGSFSMINNITGNDIRIPIRASGHHCGRVSEGSTWIRLKVRHKVPSCMCKISSALHVHESQFPTQSIAFLHQSVGSVDGGETTRFDIISAHPSSIFHINNTSGEISIRTFTLIHTNQTTGHITVRCQRFRENGEILKGNTQNITLNIDASYNTTVQERLMYKRIKGDEVFNYTVPQHQYRPWMRHAEVSLLGDEVARETFGVKKVIPVGQDALGNAAVEIYLLRSILRDLSGSVALIVRINEYGCGRRGNETIKGGRTLDIAFNVTIWPMVNYESIVYSNITAGSPIADLSSLVLALKRPLPAVNGEYWHSIFEMEETMEIVYVTNRTALKIIAPRVITLYVEYGSASDILDAGIIINLTITIEKTELQSCRLVDSCSRLRNRADCLTHCGAGSIHDHCSWRADGLRRAMSTVYATCTPNINTCPDNRCDPLEMEHRNDICPQDCTLRTSGFRRPLNKSLPGIQVAIGPCWCDAGGRCTCMGADARQPHPDPKPGPTLPIVRFPITTTTEPVEIHPDPEDEMCGPECYLGVSAGVFLTILVTTILAIRKRRERLHQRRAYTSSIFKPPLDAPSTARGSMVLTDYADEITSGRSFGFRSRFEHDSKWEFPRDKLLLEDELGEGHFGRVVRAQALSIRGHTGYTTVAVKMLKRDTATSSELQDLLTELELLKLLNHPNVIRLLGACIPKDPFDMCVIVEYCKHGCLREFLRQNRKRALYTEYISSDQSSSIPGLSRGKNVIKRFDIGFKEIASFAWQICKGMHYLSSLKVVHRDLAARNILVAEGLLMKISDFGLTRDVYERGLYERQSKSLLPVKWMAVEALYDNIFTVKSDVWSFGILLWEIITMGAIPYPGVTAERLCQLLREGYRMDKPAECSDELYTIMKHCWLDDPRERPSFEELGFQFEKMLEETMEYLDLSDINGDLSSEDENEDNVECHKEQCCLLRKNRDDLSSTETSPEEDIAPPSYGEIATSGETDPTRQVLKKIQPTVKDPSRSHQSSEAIYSTIEEAVHIEAV